MPEIDPLQLILTELKDVRVKADEALDGFREVKQTLHGPPGSDNGLYRDTKWMKEQMKTKIIPFIENYNADENRGVSRKDKFLFILIATVLSAASAYGVHLLTAPVV